ncbi:MAG: 2-hydroxyacid dehydrogenase [Endozoicomonadaceae bacterium]|nr:2-hydroxyacid dehydrogenase [Endozoicomonadaceae bacterium]
MYVAVFGSKPYDVEYLDRANRQYGLKFNYLKAQLNEETRELVRGHDAVCVFVNDKLDQLVLETMADAGIRLIALRCAGFNNVNLRLADKLDIKVARVPAYSPEAVAEHTLALILTLNRKTHKAWNRIRENNFSLNGLLGFNMIGKTVGVVGLGRVGIATAKLLKGFNMNVLAYDPFSDELAVKAVGIKTVPLQELYHNADIITLHCPLTDDTFHMIDAESLESMKPGAMLINTSRGGLIDTQAVICSLKAGHLGYLGVDVYEQESDLFFEDMSEQIIQDEMIQSLQSLHNVLITGHQGFFTREALTAIAETTLANLYEFDQTGTCKNLLAKNCFL